MSESYSDKIAKALGYSPPPPEAPAVPEPSEPKLKVLASSLGSMAEETYEVTKAIEEFIKSQDKYIQERNKKWKLAYTSYDLYGLGRWTEEE